jgi:hypothetical protein
MLRKVCNGKSYDECYSILWRKPYGNYEINGIQDNERDKFYKLPLIHEGDLLDLVRDLNMKEQFRTEHYKSIVESFEKTIRQAEDRWLEQLEENQKLFEENQRLKNKLKIQNIKI